MSELRVCKQQKANPKNGKTYGPSYYDWVPVDPQPLWANPEYVAELEKRNRELYNQVEDLKMRLALTTVPEMVKKFTKKRKDDEPDFSYGDMIGQGGH